MSLAKILETCRTLIGNNKVKQAINLLEENFQDGDYLAEIVLQKNKLAHLQKQERLGLLSFSEASTERNKIVHALLSLIGDIKDGNPISKEDTQKDQPTTQIINIINSKNVNTGNVTTNGGDFTIGDAK